MPKNSLLQNYSSPGNLHHKAHVKEEGPKRCYRSNSTVQLRNLCPKLKKIKPHPVHVNVAVISTETPETPTVCMTSFVGTSPAEPDREHIKVVRISDRECIGWRDSSAQISLVKQNVVQETDMLPGQMAELILIGRSRIPVPLAKVHVE
ncbi:hypothetical protein KIL84_018375 [Mauremys mutica]|uniref:Uncharacterized protein n=1 Tax=Mauremys mutica TaxID=74926 RepID=A0A9D4B9C7_9SAUR|nr:hypothetical protein KIL84_018375 [Mauremys mutica]